MPALWTFILIVLFLLSLLIVFVFGLGLGSKIGGRVKQIELETEQLICRGLTQEEKDQILADVVDQIIKEFLEKLPKRKV